MGQKHAVESRGEGGGGEIISGLSPFDILPEDCISNIISFTSPRDACVAALVSKTFESAVKSDSVWEKFLPLEYASLIPQVSTALCDNPVLIEEGKKV